MTTTTPAGDEVLVNSDGAVVTISINRPHRKNALTAPMIARITEAITAAAQDDTTRAVVLRAEGDDFCTGIDLAAANRRRGPEEPRPRTGHVQRRIHYNAHELIRALDAVQLPVIAAVRGWVAGVGLGVALSADIVVADPTARFWAPFVGRGLTPDSGTTWVLPRLVGLARAKEMLLRGTPVAADRAERWGMISEVVGAADLDREVGRIAAEMAALPTLAVGLTRTLIHRNLDVSRAAALESEGMHEELALRSDDFKEGLKAFMERRPADYRGR